MNSARIGPMSMFPSIESWKAAMLQLPEGPFFDILRSYLGDIKTPFNKQRLVDDLAAFLSRQDIQQRIAALLDDGDRRCIAAVALLHPGTLQDLAAFFEGDYSFAELYGIMLNLEERLVIYRTVVEGRAQLYLNPLLEPVLAPLLQNCSFLFPAKPADAKPPELSLHPDLILGALLAWLSGTGQAFKSDGSLKKKAHEELETCFAWCGGASLAGDLIHAIEYLGILRIEEGLHHIDEDRLASFASLEPAERLQFLAAALIAVDLELESTSRRLSRERLQNWTRLIEILLQDMQEGWIYDERSLRRLWLIEEGRSLERRRFGERELAPLAGLSHCPGVNPVEFFQALLNAMERAALLLRVEDGFIRRPLPGASVNSTSAQQALLSPGNPRAPVVCDAGFSLIVYPEIPFKGLCTLTRFSRLRELGQTLKLEITQECFVRALDHGFRLETIRDLLETLSAKPIPQSLAWSLSEWERRYNSAGLYNGMVLVLAQDLRYIAELEMVKSFIERELAPGVYLLRGIEEDRLSEVLEKAGLETLARPQPSRTGQERTGGSGSALPPASPAFARMKSCSHFSNKTFGDQQSAPAPEPPAGAATPPGAFATQLIQELHAKLEAKPFTKEQKDELSARIDRRLILDESQLVAAAVRYEKLEARGLDYVGKVRLIEQALAQGALVELYWRGPKGEANRAILRPQALEKSGTELMIRGASYPDGEVLTLPIGKISLLRRIKRSIFGD